MSAAGISGASRIAGFGEGTPQQVSREGQNRRIADFGTVVETCSKTAADCPCLGFSVHRANRAGLSARWLRLFPFPLKIHFKGRQLPAGREFFKISFASVMRESEFWQPAGQVIFFLLSTTDKNQKCQTPGQKNFPLTYYYNLNRAKWPGAEPGNKKSSKSFSDLLLSLAAPVAAGIQLFFSYDLCFHKL